MERILENLATHRLADSLTRNPMPRTLFLILIITLVGCTTPGVVDATPTPEPLATPTLTAVPPTEQSEPPESGPVTLKVWIPPQFDPGDGSPEGEVLHDRLEVFSKRRSDILIETRIKAVDGPGGMIDTLSTAGAAAPLALPDLVLLPEHILQDAAINGLLHPFDGLTDIMDEPDWYDFARQISQLQNNTFGIPFSGDALLMVYRSSVVDSPPSDWAATLEIPEPLAFSAADPDGLVTLTFYQSAGGAVLDDENNPILDTVQLTEVLTYYRQATISSLMPFWITQFENDAQAWDAYQEGQAQMAVTWASNYLDELPSDSDAAPLPTYDGAPFTLASGWAWALVSPDPERQTLSVQLAEFLSTSGFLAEWNEAGGTIPPRPSALDLWSSGPNKVLLGPISESARLVPPPDMLATLGPILQSATIEILKDQADPVVAAESALEKLTSP